MPFVTACADALLESVISVARFARTLAMLQNLICLMVQEEALLSAAGITKPGDSQPSGLQPPGDLLMGADDELPAWAQADTEPEGELTLPLALGDAPPASDTDGPSVMAEPEQLSSEDQQQRDEQPMHQEAEGELPACAQSRAHAEPQPGAEWSASQVVATSFTLCPT